MMRTMHALRCFLVWHVYVRTLQHHRMMYDVLRAPFETLCIKESIFAPMPMYS